MVVQNEGDQPIGVTNNYFNTGQEARTVAAHDDTAYGHGLECLPGTMSSQDFPLGGVSLLIIIGVGLDTVKQIDAKLQQHHYEGILR